MKTTFKQQDCPVCKHPLNRGQTAEEEAVDMSIGAIGCCVYCGEVLMFGGEDVGLIAVPDNVVERLKHEFPRVYQQIKTAQEVLKK